MPVAGKTGTTSATRDVWFAGFTPIIPVQSWVGSDTNELLVDECKSFHKTLWKKMMGRIHSELPSADFEIPSNVQQATICSESGLLAGLGCSTRTEYFESSTIPTTRCTQHYVLPHQNRHRFQHLPKILWEIRVQKLFLETPLFLTERRLVILPHRQPLVTEEMELSL